MSLILNMQGGINTTAALSYMLQVVVWLLARRRDGLQSPTCLKTSPTIRAEVRVGGAPWRDHSAGCPRVPTRQVAVPIVRHARFWVPSCPCHSPEEGGACGVAWLHV